MNKIAQSKVVLLGQGDVGKSALILRLVRNEFAEFLEPTVGAAFFTHDFPLPDSSTVRLEIWDTAGQERYRALAPMYYRGAPAAIVVYDITKKDSFTTAKNWVDELRMDGTVDVVIALAGNKCDLKSKREVFTNEAQRYANENGLIFFETSAKTNRNVHELFAAVAERVPRTPIEEETSEEKPDDPGCKC